MLKTARPIKALLVEDDPDLIDITIEFLEISGCTVTPVGSPEEAVPHIESGYDYDLLFTDYRFPSPLNGIQLAERMKSQIPQVKVIIATGLDRESIQSQISTDYQVLGKPYRLEELKSLIEELFVLSS
jgi:CheY-like chemotaxis protein